MAREAALLARMTRLLAGTQPQAPLALRLLEALCEVLGVDGAAVTIGYSMPDRTTLCATDAVADHVEDLQDVLREGPSLDAFRSGHVVCAPVDGQVVRWPLLAQALSEDQPGLWLCAVPMRPEQDLLGVISLYRSTDGGIDFENHEARFLADTIGVALLGRFDREKSTQLLWSTRDSINQATGMVVAQLAVPPADALAVLRAHAFAQGASLADVSVEVVARRLDFRDGSSDETR